MTAIALSLKRGGLLCPLPPSLGVGPEAREVETQIEIARDHLFESVSIRIPFVQAVEALDEAAEEAAVANWDGYGARQIDARAYVNAVRFLTTLPTTTPRPDVAIDPDGEVSLSWQLAPRNVFSISVGAHGRLTYAGLFGASKVHGTEWLRAEIPQPILDGIARVFSSEMGTRR